MPTPTTEADRHEIFKSQIDALQETITALFGEQMPEWRHHRLAHLRTELESVRNVWDEKS